MPNQLLLKKLPKIGETLGPWRCSKQLGTGSFGAVFVWTQAENGERLAVKICRFGPEVPQFSEKHCDQWRQEVDIMLRLDHPNVVKCRRPPVDIERGLLENPRTDLPLLCMEYCDGGDLRSVLNRPESCCGLPQVQVLALVYDITSALEFLHNRRIIHRDLKPENVVLFPNHKDSAQDFDENDDENSTWKQTTPRGKKPQDRKSRTVFKLIDLGYAKELGQSSMALSFVGTLQYLAPELFLGQEYSKVVDYWSLGLIAHEAVTGQRPFLPTFSPGQWMDHVEAKANEVICIYETVDDLENPPFITSRTTFFQENYLSRSVAADLESWIRTLLEWRSNLRGRRIENGEIVIFNDLESLLAKTRINVISVDRSTPRLDYEISDQTRGIDLATWIERDTQIPVSEQLLLMGPSYSSVEDEDDVLGEPDDEWGNEVKMEDFIQPLVSSVRRKQRLDPVDPYPVTIYAFGLGNASIPVANLIRRVEINLPVSLQKILKNAKAEVTFPHRKLLCSHLYYFTKAERQTAEDFKRGLQVFGLRIRKLISELKTTWSTVLRMLDRCLSQQELFMESLRHDMEKYRTQTLNKDHIVSQKTYDSWVQSERDVTAKTKKASEDVNLADMRLKLLFNEVSKDLSGNELMKLQDGESTPEDKFDSLAEKSLSLVKALKFIPIEGRAERDSVKDIAQHVVKCLKTRDAYLQHLFNRKEKLISQFSQLQEASVSNTELARDLDLLSTSISKMQRRRQSDIWKLLAAAISNASTSPEPPGSHHFGARARTTSTSNPPPMMMTLNPSILAQLEISSGRTEVLSVESRRLMATAEEAVKVAMNR